MLAYQRLQTKKPKDLIGEFRKFLECAFQTMQTWFPKQPMQPKWLEYDLYIYQKAFLKRAVLGYIDVGDFILSW